MQASDKHIATSHVGSLPRPDSLIATYRALEAGEHVAEHVFRQTLQDSVADVVRRQRDIGNDIPGDGEFGKPMGQRAQYGSWWRYSWQRLSGLEIGGPTAVTVVLDQDMLDSEWVNFHPLHNAASTTLRSADLVRFVRALSYQPVIVRLPEHTALRS